MYSRFPPHESLFEFDFETPLNRNDLNIRCASFLILWWFIDQCTQICRCTMYPLLLCVVLWVCHFPHFYLPTRVLVNEPVGEWSHLNILSDEINILRYDRWFRQSHLATCFISVSYQDRENSILIEFARITHRFPSCWCCFISSRLFFYRESGRGRTVRSRTLLPTNIVRRRTRKGLTARTPRQRFCFSNDEIGQEVCPVQSDLTFRN